MDSVMVHRIGRASSIRSLFLAFALWGAVGSRGAQVVPMGRDPGGALERAVRTIERTLNEQNRLSPFTPQLDIDRHLRPLRHTPAILVSSPWCGGEPLFIQAPEYVWARIPGEPRRTPFFYGVELGTLEGRTREVRFPPLEEPAWQRRVDGGLELNVRLSGGFVQRLQAIPHDRMFEIRFGVTNHSDKPLDELSCQLCLSPRGLSNLGGRDPDTVSMLWRGDVIDWTFFGQGLSWMDEQRDPMTCRIVESCFFVAASRDSRIEKWEREPLQRGNRMRLQEPIDIPAIVKSDRGGNQHVLVYSPAARGTLYNAKGPCFHSDPEIAGIAPGETRWASTYFAFFEGDVSEPLRALAREHAELRQGAGYLDGPGLDCRDASSSQAHAFLGR